MYVAVRLAVGRVATRNSRAVPYFPKISLHSYLQRKTFVVLCSLWYRLYHWL